MMKSPPSEIFQQLRLSEQKQNQSQRQKLDGRHTSTKGRHDVSTGGVTKLKLPTRERNVGKTTVRGRKGENLLIHTYPPDDLASFEREFSVMSAVSKIPALVNHAPRVVKADPSSGVLVLSTPSLYWTPLLHSMEASKLGLDQLLELKQKLRSYVKLLYSHGVAYRVKHNFVFPAQKLSGRWVLYLGGWMDADLCPDSSQLEPTEWREREAKQLDEIERLFELLVRRYEDMQDERKGRKGHRCERWRLEEQLQPQT